MEPHSDHEPLPMWKNPLGHANMEQGLTLTGRLPAEQHEIALIYGVWKSDFGWLCDLGLELYTRIFRRDPELQRIFPGIAELPEADWPTAKPFRKQALRFMQTLARVVQELKDPDRTLSAYLAALGKRHHNYMVNAAHAEHAWGLFHTAFNEVMLLEIEKVVKPEDRDLAVDVWDRFMKAVLDGMRFGYFGHLPEDT